MIGISSTKTDEYGQPTNPQAFLWQSGHMRALGTLPGGKASTPLAINERGQIVGRSETGGRSESGARAWHAFLWQGGRMTDLGALPDFPESTAVDINEKGQIVGYAIYDSGGNIYDTAPLLWQDGKMTRLASPGGNSHASTIDDRGWILGAGQNPSSDGQFLALLWQNGKMTNLGRLERKQGNSFATASNGSGLIIGTSDTHEGSHAVVWENRRITDLGTLGGSESDPVAINSSGQIAGTSETRTDWGKHPVLWTLRRGTWPSVVAGRRIARPSRPDSRWVVPILTVTVDHNRGGWHG